MAHARQQIKTAVITAVTGLTTTGANVFVDEVHPTAAGSLPALTVRVDREDLRDDLGDMGDMEIREMTMIVDAVEQDKTSLSTNLDQICLEVEAGMMSNQALFNLVFDYNLRSTAFELSGDGDEPIGTASMEWVLSYQIDRAAPDTII